MRNQILLILFALTTLVAGCSKETTTPGRSETRYPVTFSVSAFSSGITPMNGQKSSSIQSPLKLGLQASTKVSSRTTSTPLGNEVRYLEYYVLNTSGNIVQQGKIDRDNLPHGQTEFGRIEETLPEGDYSVLIVGSNGGITYSGKGESSFLYNFSTGFEGNYGYSDVFLKLINIIVANDPIAEAVSLERAVGKLEIDLQDELPSDLSRIEYSISRISTFYYPFNWSSNTTGSFKRTASGSQHNFKDDLFLYFFYQNPTSENIGKADVNIRAYNNNGDLIADKQINDVPVGVNQKTVLTGKLFENPGTAGQGFTVTVNSEWSSTHNVDF